MKRLCARCGERIEPTKHIYSKYTRNYYCWDIDACEERCEQNPFREITMMADAIRKEIEDHGFKAV